MTDLDDDLDTQTSEPIKRKRRTKAEIESENKAQVTISESGVKKLKSLGFNDDWLDKLSVQYGFTRFEYIDKFSAFRCYLGDTHVDWIDINDLSLLNGGRRLTTIQLKHQALAKDRQVIQYAWR